MLLTRSMISYGFLIIFTIQLLKINCEDGRVKRFSNWNQAQTGWNQPKFQEPARNNTYYMGNGTYVPYHGNYNHSFPIHPQTPRYNNKQHPVNSYNPTNHNQTHPYYIQRNNTNPWQGPVRYNTSITHATFLPWPTSSPKYPQTPRYNNNQHPFISYNRTDIHQHNKTRPFPHPPTYNQPQPGPQPGINSRVSYVGDVPLAPYPGSSNQNSGRLYPDLTGLHNSHSGSNYNLTQLSYGGGSRGFVNTTPKPSFFRFKRSIEDKRDQVKPQEDKKYQPCLTSNGYPGYCKYMSQCKTEKFDNDLLKVLDHICIIERSAIGVCCPETNPQQINLRKITRIDTKTSDDEERGCGISALQKPKITGGRKTEVAEFPWMAALKPLTDRKVICGGVLITDRHVLTAGHCVDALKPRQLRVRLGEYDFGKDNETIKRDFSVSEIRVHIDFNPITYENDIAVIKLRQSTTFTPYIWPICMPPIDTNWENYMGVVIGWGTQFYTGPISKVLMKVEVPIWNNQACQDVYTNNKIYDTVMCAGAPAGGKDACQGDSGGPLMIQLPNDRWVVAGIVSYGMRCGEPNRPGIYTRVNSYTKWIIENSVF